MLTLGFTMSSRPAYCNFPVYSVDVAAYTVAGLLGAILTATWKKADWLMSLPSLPVADGCARPLELVKSRWDARTETHTQPTYISLSILEPGRANSAESVVWPEFIPGVIGVAGRRRCPIPGASSHLTQPNNRLPTFGPPLRNGLPHPLLSQSPHHLSSHALPDST